MLGGEAARITETNVMMRGAWTIDSGEDGEEDLGCVCLATTGQEAPEAC